MSQSDAVTPRDIFRDNKSRARKGDKEGGKEPSFSRNILLTSDFVFKIVFTLGSGGANNTQTRQGNRK